MNEDKDLNPIDTFCPGTFCTGNRPPTNILNNHFKTFKHVYL